MKTPLLLLGICAGLYGTAQTLNESDTLSTGDSRAYYVLDSTASALPGMTGTGVNWDYSTIGGYGLPANNNNVIAAGASTFAADFPSAHYAEEFENSVNTFFSNDDAGDQVIVHGFVFQELSSDFVIKYDVDQLIAAKFPMNQGDTYTDDIAGTATVPLAGDVAITGSATITADGTGTLVIGTNSYSDVIRIHTVEVSNGVILGSPAVITRESYVYYDLSDGNMPIFMHASVLAELGAGGDFGFTAVYSKDNTTEIVGIESETVESLDLTIYPNPASGAISFGSVEGTEKLTVLNSVGQVILTINNPSTTEQIDLSTYNRGIYFVQATKGGAIRTEKFVVK